MKNLWKAIATAFTVAAVVYAIRTRHSHDRFLRVLYDFRYPTLQKVRD